MAATYGTETQHRRDELILRCVAEDPRWYSAKVLDRLVPAFGGCWLWTGGHQGGYGCVGLPTRVTRPTGQRGGVVRVHRVVKLAEHGPQPFGLVLDHLCRTPLCANPAHLESVLPAENTRRGTGNWFGRRCVRLHPGQDTIRADESSACLACRAVMCEQNHPGEPPGRLHSDGRCGKCESLRRKPRYDPKTTREGKALRALLALRWNATKDEVEASIGSSVPRVRAALAMHDDGWPRHQIERRLGPPPTRSRYSDGTT